ncbi:MAG: phage minor head protein [Thermodesulfobacteriota bacterium]
MVETTLTPLPMKEAEEFWRDKVKLSPSEFAKLSAEAQVRAFAVSGIARGGELDTVFTAMNRAISKGVSFSEFQRDAAAVFERRGWVGKRAWRIDNLFRTNIQTAYHVGRFEQIRAVKKTRPYLQYDAVNDSRTRPTHAALDGKVFPADHPFWNRWYPPNGFRCRCGVTTLSEDDVREEGLKVETRDPTGRLIEPVDPVTGAKLPARALMPDKGFSYHPGKTVWGGFVQEESAGGKWETLPGLKKAADYSHKPLKDVGIASIPDIDETRFLPGGKGDAFYNKEFKKLYGEETVLKDSVGDPVILTLRSFLEDKGVGVREAWKFSKAGHGESIPLLKEMIENPYEIWLAPQRNSAGKIRLTKRYISLWKTPDKKRVGGFMVFEVERGVFQGVTSFIPLKKGKPDLGYLERRREGVLLRRKGR